MARILIVEDHVLVRRLLWQILTDAGHEIVGEAEDGHAAVGRLSSLRPDLVMFGLSTSVRRELSALERMMALKPALPVLVCAGTGHIEEARTAVRGGARGFIVKPFSRDIVLSAVRHVLLAPVVLREGDVELRSGSQ